jgi:hypothetical protein
VFLVDVIVALLLLALLPKFLEWNPKAMTTDEETQAQKVAVFVFVFVVLAFLYLRMK